MDFSLKSHDSGYQLLEYIMHLAFDLTYLFSGKITITMSVCCYKERIQSLTSLFWTNSVLTILE